MARTKETKMSPTAGENDTGGGGFASIIHLW